MFRYGIPFTSLTYRLAKDLGTKPTPQTRTLGSGPRLNRFGVEK